MAVPLLFRLCVLNVWVLLDLSTPGAHGLGHFLLNVTDETSHLGFSDPPQYMLDLYRRGTVPHTRTVRSFRSEDWSSERVMGESVRSLRLHFNISVPQQESLVRAQLRLHMRIRRPASGWKISVLDGHNRDLLASKHSRRRTSGWEAFDITNAIRHWRKINIMTPSLEVRIENQLRNVDDWEYADIDVDLSPDGKHEPALIIFSDTPNKVWRSGDSDTDSILEDGSRVRRSAKMEDCKMAEMYVNFKDIGWDSFILAPSGYQAFTCRGACDFPLAREVTPTKHAIVRTLLNLKSPGKASRSCCVPTVLQPLSVLYVDKNGVVVLENYEGMVVKECGCR